MHLRSPSSSQGFAALVWGVGLGFYVWIFLLAVAVSGALSFLFGLLAGIGIFFFVLLAGGERYRR